MKTLLGSKALFLLAVLILLGSCKGRNNDKHEAQTNQIGNEQTIQTICFGSCNKQWMDQSYWKLIQNENPDLWIWMGDIIYADTEDMDQLKQQYDIQKNHMEYRAFVDSIAVIGIWDDHDYGLNDGGNEYPQREASRDLLFDFMDLPESDKAWSRDGAYQSYVYGPDGRQVKIMLLDGRYFRDKLEADTMSDQRYLPNTSGTYLGEQQWKWLEKELNESKAQVNLIVSGIQVIPTEHFFEKWSNFPAERKRLFRLIQESGVKNPVFLSGDRHIAEISKLEIDSTFTLYEATSSGLTHSYEKADEENQFRISPLITSRNFGKIQINWDGEFPVIELSINNISGEQIFAHRIVSN